MGWWPSRSVTFVDNHDTGSTQEREAEDIVVPDIKWNVFELMKRCNFNNPYLMQFYSTMMC
ncbi:putative alpha-amylase [Arachis hypogaea]|nr:putative alpha-amylase [Arachis hypogaea]